MSFTNISYEEPIQSKYESVEITSFKGEKRIFDSGDFIKDWYDATKYIITELTDDPFL